MSRSSFGWLKDFQRNCNAALADAFALRKRKGSRSNYPKLTRQDRISTERRNFSEKL
jgi:hypothetical protein